MKIIGLTCILLAGAANAGYSSSQTATATSGNGGGFDAGYQAPFQAGASLQAQNLAFHQQLQQQALDQGAAIQAQVQQQIYESQNGFGGAYGGGGYSGGYPNYAGSSASIGPDGVHHQGFINPPNPASPNFDTRFDADPVVGGVPGGYGVSSASFSSSSNVNGVETNKRGSQTVVNDNGKITTYETHS